MTDAVSILKEIAGNSAVLATTAIGVFGGSVAAVIGTSYRRPDALAWRLPSLLFAPGWVCLAVSLYLGNVITGRYLASTMVVAADLPTIAERINDDYASQRNWFLCSLVFFGLWLFISLGYWVFIGPSEKEAA